MAVRTWNNINVPTGKKTISFWLKSSLTSTSFDIDLDVFVVNVEFSGTDTLISVAGTLVKTISGINDDEWHMVIIEIDASDGVIVHSDNNISLEASKVVAVGSSSGLASADLSFEILSSSLALAMIRLSGGNIELWNYGINFIYEDVIKNSGDSFYGN